jgi:uncharacterized protein YqhQ
MAERRIYYGGQAVMEGVMIRGPRTMAVACRRPDGNIIVRGEPLTRIYTGAIRHIPFLRGVVVLWETMALGMRALMFSANVAIDENSEKKEEEIPTGGVPLPMLLFLGAIVVFFFAGPLLLADWLDNLLNSYTLAIIIEGAIRLLIVVAYVGLIGLLPDIRRVYAYHGAEHKSIHAMEHGDPLEPQHVQKYPTAHVRCGTSFLLTVVVVSIIVFGAVGDPDLWIRVLSRIVLIPVIAAISYEVIRVAGAFEHNPITRVLMWPNLALQKLTTREPDDSQVEVALTALKEVLAAEESVQEVEAKAEAAAEAPPLD